MNIYKRMIRPMINPPSLQGMNDSPYPLISDDYWVDDEHEEVKRGVWEQEVKREDKMGSLLVEEKYVLVESPKIQIRNVAPNDFILLSFDINEFDMDTVCQWLDGYAKAFPNNAVGALPTTMSLDIMSKESAYVFIEHYKELVDKKYCKGDEDV